MATEGRNLFLPSNQGLSGPARGRCRARLHRPDRRGLSRHPCINLMPKVLSLFEKGLLALIAGFANPATDQAINLQFRACLRALPWLARVEYPGYPGVTVIGLCSPRNCL